MATLVNLQAKKRAQDNFVLTVTAFMHDCLNVVMCNKAYGMAHLDSNSCLSYRMQLFDTGRVLAEWRRGTARSEILTCKTFRRPSMQLSCTASASAECTGRYGWFMCGVLLDGTCTLFLPAVHWILMPNVKACQCRTCHMLLRVLNYALLHRVPGCGVTNSVNSDAGNRTLGQQQSMRAGAGNKFIPT